MFCCSDFQLESKKDAFSAELQHYCHTQPVVVIRGIATALKLGTSSAGLYSSRCSHYGRHGYHSTRGFVEVKRIPDCVFGVGAGDTMFVSYFQRLIFLSQIRVFASHAAYLCVTW